MVGARIGPLGRPARSVSSVLPLAAGKSWAVAVGAGAGGGAVGSLVDEPQPARASTAAAANMGRAKRIGQRTIGGLIRSPATS